MSAARWGITYRGTGYVPGPGDYSPPDEPDWCECDDCRGTGKVTERIEYASGPRDEEIECPACDGCGWFDEVGNPVKEEA